MPILRIKRSRAWRRCRTVSTPSMRIEPASGSIKPRMHLTSTDLPAPEPPMTTRLCPAAQSMSRPSSTQWSPNDFFSPLTEIFGTAIFDGAGLIAGRRSLPEEGGGEHVIGDEYHDRGRNHRIGRRLPHSLRPALRVITVIAAHQRHDQPKNAGFDETRHHIPGFEILLGVGQIRRRIEVEPVDADEI